MKRRTLLAAWKAILVCASCRRAVVSGDTVSGVVMTCFRPLRGWRSAEPNENGKYPIVFSATKRHADLYQAVDVPCGQCIGCRLERSRQWALRCVHELKEHEYGCFVTLTFNDMALRRRGHHSVAVRDLQLFMKRVRKRYGVGVKFMASGEYGDGYGRPHYHVCLFGVDFKDKVYWRTTDSGEKIFRSKILEALWSNPSDGSSYGYSSVGALTYQSAAYVARYVLKKQVGKTCVNGVYSMSVADLDYRTGRITPRRSEFATMSNGLGKKWFDKYHEEWYRSDSVIVEGREVGLPRYYDRQLEMIDADAFARVKDERRRRAKEQKWNNTDRRLKVRETVCDSRLSRLFRHQSFGA